ncbi:MAG: hypothetical protein IAF38_12500, partial [Bacteroidia bacterium]|nr:hypothetical protein [Bacteroidia bacterium]
MKNKFVMIIVFLFLLPSLNAQNHWKNKTGFILEFGNVPAWAGIVDLAPAGKKPVYVFDDNIYKGHSNFVLRFLKRKVTFAAFKDLVKYPATRQYIPFNLYDLRKKDFSYNNEKYSWALKMCDYRLQDNSEEMIKLVSETYTHIKNYLESIDSACGKGIILLSNSETATPNISSLEGIKKLGLPVCQLKEFNTLIKYNPKTNQVLNPGTINGIIHYLNAGEEDDAVNDGNAIYVFEKTPERVPLAKGFITLQPQTFLSHINLLAINRKTPNVSVSDNDLVAQLKTLNGKPVKLSCDKEKNSVEIENAELSSVTSLLNTVRKR